MSLIRISESDDWIVDYDRDRGMYRVSYFEDNHFKDEHWFDCYEDKEVDDRIEKIIERLERLKTSGKDNMLSTNKYLSADSFEYLFDLIVYWIKGL